MDEGRKSHHDGDTIAQGKRSSREGVEPGGQPGEFADDFRVNRTEPPPDPKQKKKD